MVMKKPMTTRRPAVPMKKAGTTTISAKPLEVIEETSVVEPVAPAPTARRARKPVVPGKAVAPAEPVKEVVPSGTYKEPEAVIEEPSNQSKQGTSAEASKPATTSERTSEPTQPRPADTGEEDQAKDQRLSDKEMKAMSLAERYEHYRSINSGKTGMDIPIRKELPKNMVLRKDEAIERGVVTPNAPRLTKGSQATVHYCPYCVDWQPFHTHSWSGYTKCCGCGISTMDFYTRSDNELFGV